MIASSALRSFHQFSAEITRCSSFFFPALYFCRILLNSCTLVSSTGRCSCCSESCIILFSSTRYLLSVNIFSGSLSGVRFSTTLIGVTGLDMHIYRVSSAQLWLITPPWITKSCVSSTSML